MHYDYIIAGGGAAGLSLACHMIRSQLSNRTILIIDKDDDDQLQRNWGFWTCRPTLFDEVVHHSWQQLEFASGNDLRRIDLGPYRYKLMHGADFYRYALEQLALCPNVTFARGVIHHIDDGVDRAQVTVADNIHTAEWVFDSVIKPADLRQQLGRHQFLCMQFKGWEIQTTSPVFDPGAARLMDFRIPQQGQMRFVYLMPFSPTHAFVEFTAFTAAILHQDVYTVSLNAYLGLILGASDFRILSEENGAVPITDVPFQRRLGRRVMAIGAKAGRIKPSTGYSFMRIQKDSAAIVQQILATGTPSGVAPDRAFFRLCDSMMLRIMRRCGPEIGPIFSRLFASNPIERVFRFLDEEATLPECAAVTTSLPLRTFLLAIL